MRIIENFDSFNESRTSPEEFPSKEFGEKTGMGWIWVDWKIPTEADKFAATLRKLYDDLEEANKEKGEKIASDIIELYKKVAEMNPAMKELGDPKSWQNIYDFLQGVNSKFNIDDIKFYSGLGWDERAEYNIKNRSTSDAISAKADAVIGWVMSPTTIERVKKELKMK